MPWLQVTIVSAEALAVVVVSAEAIVVVVVSAEAIVVVSGRKRLEYEYEYLYWYHIGRAKHTAAGAVSYRSVALVSNATKAKCYSRTRTVSLKRCW